MTILPEKTGVRNVPNVGYSLYHILPDALRSQEEYQRLYNLDLGGKDAFSLWQELFKVKMALAHIDPQRQPWLFVEPGKFLPALQWLKARYEAIKKEGISA